MNYVYVFYTTNFTSSVTSFLYTVFFQRFHHEHYLQSFMIEMCCKHFLTQSCNLNAAILALYN